MRLSSAALRLASSTRRALALALSMGRDDDDDVGVDRTELAAGSCGFVVAFLAGSCCSDVVFAIDVERNNDAFC